VTSEKLKWHRTDIIHTGIQNSYERNNCVSTYCLQNSGKNYNNKAAKPLKIQQISDIKKIEILSLRN
jgi:hypothetical protein